MPTKGEVLGFDAWEIGLILATGSFAFSVSSYFTGAISEKVGRKIYVLASLGLLVLSGVGLVYADSLSLLIGFYVLFCLTNAVPYLLSFVYASEAFDTSYIGAAMGAFDSLMDLSLLIAPLLGVAALGMTGEMAYPLLLAVLPAFLGTLCDLSVFAGIARSQNRCKRRRAATASNRSKETVMILSQALFRSATLFLFCTVAFSHSFAQIDKEDETKIIGNKEFVHLEEVGGIWTMINGDGEPFIPLGMNHVDPCTDLPVTTKKHWIEKIGGGIMKGKESILSPKEPGPGWR